MNNQSKYKIVTETKSIESKYQDTPVNILDNLPFYQYRTLRMCEFYANSTYLGGNRDELGRDKPFFNVVNYRVTLAKVATDLDVKDIQISADEPEDWIRSMLLQHEAYEWMKETNFAGFLNKMGYTRPKYGGVLTKETKVKGDLIMEVVDWRNVVTDQCDIIGGTIVEHHYMTPVELAAKKGVWENVNEALKEAARTKTSTTNYGSSNSYGAYGQEYNSERIKVYEVHGQFPVSFLKDAKGEDYDEDEWEFSQQQYFFAQIGNDTFMFYAESEKESPYDYLPWEEMPGRGLGRGVIEDAEQAQIWTNNAVIGEKNAMELAGKVVLKTNSKKIGNNIFEVDNGKIFELDDQKDLSMLSLNPGNMKEFSTQIQNWRSQADLSTGSVDATTGEQPPSGTPYSQTALLNQVASKPFDYRREEAGIFITRLFEKRIIPFLVKKLYKKHLLVSDFSEDELDIIDQSFGIYKANKEVIKRLTEGEPTTPQEYQQMMEAEKSKLRGSKRYFTIKDGFFDDIEAKVTVVTTNEQKNKAAILQSLSTVLQTVQSTYNPQTGTFAILENPVMSRIFGTILELSGSGISPVSLGIGKNKQTSAVSSALAQPAAQPAPQMAQSAPQGQPMSA